MLIELHRIIIKNSQKLTVFQIIHLIRSFTNLQINYQTDKSKKVYFSNNQTTVNQSGNSTKMSWSVYFRSA